MELTLSKVVKITVLVVIIVIIWYLIKCFRNPKECGLINPDWFGIVWGALLSILGKRLQPKDRAAEDEPGEIPEESGSDPGPKPKPKPDDPDDPFNPDPQIDPQTGRPKPENPKHIDPDSSDAAKTDSDINADDTQAGIEMDTFKGNVPGEPRVEFGYVGETSGFKYFQMPGSQQSFISAYEPDVAWDAKTTFDPTDASKSLRNAVDTLCQVDRTGDATKLIGSFDDFGTKGLKFFVPDPDATSIALKDAYNDFLKRYNTLVKDPNAPSFRFASVQDKKILIRGSVGAGLELVGNVAFFAFSGLMIYDEVKQWRKQSPLLRARTIAFDAVATFSPFYAVAFLDRYYERYGGLSARMAQGFRYLTGTSDSGAVSDATKAGSAVAEGSSYAGVGEDTATALDEGTLAVTEGVAQTTVWTTQTALAARASAYAARGAAIGGQAIARTMSYTTDAIMTFARVTLPFMETLIPFFGVLNVFICFAITVYSIVEFANWINAGVVKRKRNARIRKAKAATLQAEIDARCEFSDSLQNILKSKITCSNNFLTAYSKEDDSKINYRELQKYVGVWDPNYIGTDGNKGVYHMTYYLNLTPVQIIDIANNNNTSGNYIYTVLARTFLINNYLDHYRYYTDSELEIMKGCNDPHNTNDLAPGSLKWIADHYYDPFYQPRKTGDPYIDVGTGKDFIRYYQDASGNWGYVTHKYMKNVNIFKYIFDDVTTITYTLTQQINPDYDTQLQPALTNFYDAIKDSIVNPSADDPIANDFLNTTDPEKGQGPSLIGPQMLIMNAMSAVKDDNFDFRQYGGVYLPAFVDFVNSVSDLFVVLTNKYGSNAIDIDKTIKFFLSKQPSSDPNTPQPIIQFLEFDSPEIASSKCGDPWNDKTGKNYFFGMVGFYKSLYGQTIYENIIITPEILDTYAYLYNSLINIQINSQDISDNIIPYGKLGNYINDQKTFKTPYNVAIIQKYDDTGALVSIQKTSTEMTNLFKTAITFMNYLNQWRLSIDDSRLFILELLMGYIFGTCSYVKTSSGAYSTEQTILDPAKLYIWEGITIQTPYDKTKLPDKYKYSPNFVPLPNKVITNRQLLDTGIPFPKTDSWQPPTGNPKPPQNDPNKPPPYTYCLQDKQPTDTTPGTRYGIRTNDLELVSQICSDIDNCVGFSANTDGCAYLYSSTSTDPGVSSNSSDTSTIYTYYNLVQPGKPPPGYSTNILNTSFLTKLKDY